MLDKVRSKMQKCSWTDLQEITLDILNKILCGTIHRALSLEFHSNEEKAWNRGVKFITSQKMSLTKKRHKSQTKLDRIKFKKQYNLVSEKE